MSFWSWLRTSTPSVKQTPPELVFLMEETLDERFGGKFVRGAVEHAFGVTIPAGGPSRRGSDYLIGQGERIKLPLDCCGRLDSDK
jgi:hypothetical protein